MLDKWHEKIIKEKEVKKMAITLTGKRTAISMKLNNGTDDKGNVKLLSLDLGSLKSADLSTADNQKAQNIINALKPCLSKVVYSVEKTHVDTMTESA